MILKKEKYIFNRKKFIYYIILNKISFFKNSWYFIINNERFQKLKQKL